jgi:prepilin-type N-terminal cleavage/methylation domain-containing protein
MKNKNIKQNNLTKKLKEFFELKTINYKLKTSSSGFTLIETMVAITVLLLSITGPLEIASKSLFSAFYARDQITAYYLAQEGIEYIKNARDNHFLYDVFSGNDSNNYWLNGLDVCIDAGNGNFSGCYISTTNPFNPASLSTTNPVLACSGNCPLMSFDSNSSLWTQTDPATNPTKFSRKIEIIPQGNTSPIVGATGREEAIIKVTVQWPTASIFGGSKTFELTGAIMNWERK